MKKAKKYPTKIVIPFALVAVLLIVVTVSVLMLIPSFAAEDEENVYLTPDGTPITGAVDIERSEWYNFLDWSDEIKNDGSMDVSSYLQACVDAHDNVFVPKGEYIVDTTVVLHSGSGIMGEDKDETVFRSNSKVHLFHAYGEYDSESDTLHRIENVLVCNLSYLSDEECTCRTVDACDVYNLTVYGLRNRRCTALYVSTSQLGRLFNTAFSEDKNAPYYSFMNRFVTVRDCKGEGIDQDVTNWYAEYIVVYCLDDFIIEGCETDHYCCLVDYQGGSALLTEADQIGTYEEFYNRIGKISNGIIYKCRCTYSGFAIWGTGAKHFTLRENYVRYAGDGNVDFEGGQDVLVYRNEIIDGFGGGPQATVGKIVYKENKFTMTEEYARDKFFLHGACDAASAWPNQHIIFDGNEFYCDYKICVINVTMFEESGLAKCTFINNKCTNTVLNSVSIKNYEAGDYTETMDLWSLDVHDNEFRFTVPLGIYQAAIYAMVGVDDIVELSHHLVWGNRDAVPTKRDFGPDFSYVNITGNTVISELDERIDGILITNSRTNDNYHAICENNTCINSNIEVINSNDDAECCIKLCGNRSDAIIVRGNISYYIDGNMTEDGRRVSADELAIQQLLTTPKQKAEKGTAVAPKNPTGLPIGVEESTLAFRTWKACEEYTLGYVFGGSPSAKSSFRLLWNEGKDEIELNFYVKTEKDDRITTKDLTVITLSLDGKTIDGTLTVRPNGTVKSASGMLFESEESYATYSAMTKDAIRVNNRIVVKIPKSLLGNRTEIYGNVAVCEKNKTDIGTGFVTGANETDASKLAKIILSDTISKISIGNEQAGDANGDGKINRADLSLAKDFLASYDKENAFFAVSVVGGIDVNGDGDVTEADITLLESMVGDALPGDVNGDGKIKGNDSTLLLKYLAGWSVSIEEANADCNGDGKIKGNDSTLLLKYLAGWDVSIG